MNEEIPLTIEVRLNAERLIDDICMRFKGGELADFIEKLLDRACDIEVDERVYDYTKNMVEEYAKDETGEPQVTN